MADTLICAGVFEPAGFRIEPATRSIQASINLDVTRAAEEETEAEAAAAEARLRTFLSALPTVRFFLYTVDASTPAAPVLRPARKTDNSLALLEGMGTPPSGTAEPILDWIEKRISKDTAAWTTPPGGEKPVLGYDGLSASQLIATSESWNAPLPQQAGLTRLLMLTDVAATGDFVVVPFFGTAVPAGDITARVDAPDNANPERDDILFTYVSGLFEEGGIAPQIAARVRRIATPPTDRTLLVDPNTGFLEIRAEAAVAYDVLGRIRERSASLLAFAPQLLGLQWPADPGTGTILAGRTLPRLIWRGMNGLVALLDTTVIALTMAGTTREGPFVSAFNWVIEQVGPMPAISAEEVTKWITDGVLNAVSTPNEGQADKRKAYVQLIAELFQIAELKDRQLLEGANTASAWKERLNATTGLLPALMTLYARYSPTDLPTDILAKAKAPGASTLEPELDVELSALLRSLETEQGLEALALRLLGRAGIDAPRFAAKFGVNVELSERIFADFERRIGDAFNGLEASRAAAGSLFEGLLLEPENGQAQPWTRDAIKQALGDTQWFGVRAGLLTTGKFRNLAARLPVLATAFLDQTDRDTLSRPGPNNQGLLVGAFARVCDDLLADTDPTAARRFVPDPAPRPVPVRIAVDHSLLDLDSFPLNYSGVVVLVRRASDANPRWAYANLAMVTVADTAEQMAVHPLKPVAVDGQKMLFFEYQGVPLASRAFATMAGADPQFERYRPFYSYDDPELSQLGAKMPLPALAYGQSYEMASCAVSRSGALPRSIADPVDPWLPADVPEPPPAGTFPFIEGHDYSRTTAFGRVEIVENVVDRPPRFDAAIPGVAPLSRDYPRRGHCAVAGETSLFDLWRNGDGTGAISLPPATETDDRVISLNDVWAWHGGGILEITIVHDPRTTVDSTAAPQWRVRLEGPFVHGSLSLTISNRPNRRFKLAVTGQWSIEGDPEQAPADPGLAGEGAIWIRVRMTAGANGAALSFADPAPKAAAAQTTSHSTPDRTLLLKPAETTSDGRDRWSDAAPRSVEARIRLPRISHGDLDRWLSNPDLLAEAGNGETLKYFRTAVMAACMLATPNSNFERLLTNLPDPGVDKLLIELAPLDGLGDTPDALVSATMGSAETRRQEVDLRKLGDLPAVRATQDPIAQRLEKLAFDHSADLEVRTAPDDRLGLDVSTVDGRKRISVQVPAGMVARLTIRSMVHEKYFAAGPQATGALRPPPPVADRRLLELAAGKRGDHYVFDGPALTVEVMRGLKIDPGDDRIWPALAAEMIEIRPAGRARSYDLAVVNKAVTDVDPKWRRLGGAEVQTQRWRFLGRPIHDWMYPKDHCHPQSEGEDAAGIPVLRLESTSALYPFENEAFLGRDEQDVAVRPVALKPLPLVSASEEGRASTVLQTFSWQEPSATLFRHRLVLRSRYSGAMRLQADGEVIVTTKDDSDENLGRWIRIVILADRSKMQLTRPQLRALLPLTNAPAGMGAPPVLAMLEEHPLAHGGLADRIAAEVKTGFGYEVRGAGPKLELDDSRKEFGPDPRLTYYPFDAEEALALTLVPEGPVGLTFDKETVPAPAFANSAMLLTPRFMTKAARQANRDLEEHFISVVLRRYIDHRWAVGETVPTPAARELPASGSWWIEIRDAGSVKCTGTSPIDICKISQAGSTWTVSVHSQAILPEGDDSKFVDVACSDLEDGDWLALLHQPLEGGRAALSVFACSGSGKSEPGLSNLPLMLASFDWSTKEGTVDALVFDQDVNAYPVSVSPTTHMNWTRTGRNFEVLYATKADGTSSHRIQVSSLVLGVTGSGEGEFAARKGFEKLWPRPPLSAQPSPLHVHRHLGLILTRDAEGLGKGLEIFEDAFLLAGRVVPLPPSDSGSRWARLVELEVPAHPLVGNAVMADLPSPCFDLAAVRSHDAAPAKQLKGLMFSIRLLGPAKSVAAGWSGSLKLRCAGQEPINLILKRSSEGGGSFKAASIMLLVPADGQGPKVSGALIGEDGTRHKLVDRDIVPPDLRSAETIMLEGFEIRPDATAQPAECWADVSMLTFPDWPVDLGGLPFIFDWLFTGSEMSAVEAVTPREMARVPEAQARIVAVSPPIAVKPG
jgi:hypothetical protein